MSPVPKPPFCVPSLCVYTQKVEQRVEQRFCLRFHTGVLGRQPLPALKRCCSAAISGSGPAVPLLGSQAPGFFSHTRFFLRVFPGVARDLYRREFARVVCSHQPLLKPDPHARSHQPTPNNPGHPKRSQLEQVMCKQQQCLLFGRRRFSIWRPAVYGKHSPSTLSSQRSCKSCRRIPWHLWQGNAKA